MMPSLSLALLVLVGVGSPAVLFSLLGCASLLNRPLPEQWTSKALRVAMSESDWARLERLARTLGAGAPTRARAVNDCNRNVVARI